jgi:flavodoxin
MSDPDCRPAISGKAADMDQYDVVFVGFPIWWGREPSVVDTFLDAYDFSGKKIIPFCTSGGSGIGKTAEKLGEYIRGAAVLDAKLVHNADEVANW